MLSVKEIGSKIAVARKMKNISQADLAASLSVTAQAVGKWERGESMPDIIMFQNLSEALGVDLNYFSNSDNYFNNTNEVDLGSNSSMKNTDDNTNKGPEWNMSSSNWKEMDFSGLSGLAEKFNNANIEHCIFVDSELSGLVLRRNNIKHSDFNKSELVGCTFSSSNLEDSDFSGCDLSKSEFVRSNIVNCDFSEANMSNVVYKYSNIKRSKLTNAMLSGTSFKYGQFTEIIFDGEITNCAFETCDFARVEFNGAEIRNTFFKNSKLKRAKFINCKADKLSYTFMKANKADLTGVKLIDE